MSDVENILARRCIKTDGSSKVCFSKRTAKIVARRTATEAYKCSVCGFWHVGKKLPVKAKIALREALRA